MPIGNDLVLAVGSSFQVNPDSQLAQHNSSITTLSDGRFVVSWYGFNYEPIDPDCWCFDVPRGMYTLVYAQIFNADGTVSGSVLDVNPVNFRNEWNPSSITALDGGRFVIAWQDIDSTSGDTSSMAINAQIFNSDGSRFGGVFLVNSTTASLQMDPTITTLSGGGFVVSWTDFSQSGGDTSSRAVRAQVYDANGLRLGGEFLVNTTTESYQAAQAITALSGDRFVVAWTDASQTGGDTSSYAVRAQVFNGDGSRSATEFLVNTTTNGGQYSPSICELSDGRFIISWVDNSATGGGVDGNRRAQMFNNDGTLSGSEFFTEYDNSI